MQLFGVGALELLLIMVIAVLVVGPDRLPQVAAELARWVRRLRSYAQYVAGDFNEVIKELEAEVGTSREEFREIARDLEGEAKAVESDLAAAASDAEQATAQAQAAVTETAPAQAAVNPNGASNGAASGHGAEDEADETEIGETAEATPQAESDGEEEPAVGEEAGAETPWFQPARPRVRSRRRSE